MRTVRYVALVIMAMLACRACADTVVVSPSSMNGWKIATQRGSGGEPGYEFTDGYDTPPSGTGSLHLWVGYADADPLPKTYVGTNKFSGISLAKITQLKLSVCPRWSDYRSAQPITVELAVQEEDSVRLLTFLPWGYDPSGYFHRFEWKEYDLMKIGGAWEWTNTGGADHRGDWAWIAKKFAGAKITTPPVADWPDGTISGTGFNIKIGAGKSTDSVREKEKRGWWMESCGCNAYVDKLVIGYVNDNGRQVVTTYDFEAE